jgi:hypothetical protein
MSLTVAVPRRFCGPPDSGNGGYTCGLLAQQLGGMVECTLRTPVPLETPLEFERTQSGGVLRNGKTVVVEAAPVSIAVSPPPPISVDTAREAMASSPAMDPRHPFPSCFVCGPQRNGNDGLRIFPASFAEDLYAAAWLPAREFGDDQQLLRPEFLWAAMDCPTGFAAGFPTAGKLVTGRLAVQQLKAIHTGAGCVIMSWPLGIDGRKHFSAACLYQDQELRAVARATWIRVANQD